MINDKHVRSIRFGLATNSSSTHSIIHNAQIARASGSDDYDTDAEFGWEFFTAASKDAKRDYMIQQLKSNMRDTEPFRFVTNIYDAMDELEPFFMGYIDHQSVMSIPRDRRDRINMQFFADYYEYIVNGDFVVLGGNDNDDADHPLSMSGTAKKSYMWDFREDDIAQRNGNYWVVMNEKRKLRIKFEDGELQPDMPELIDLKITDYCDMGCDFCYQGSTRDGAHAETRTIKTLIDGGYHGTVFEIAIGGGEPTAHPDFAEILSSLKNNGHILNFTTKSMKWFDNQKIIDSVKENVSGIAYSVESLKDTSVFVAFHDKFIGNSCALYLHVIPELMEEDELTIFLDEIREMNKKRRYDMKIHVTMLGYKTTGRGVNNVPERFDNLIKVIKESSGVPVGIDTKIANDYAKELEEFNIDKKLYTKNEGEFSMYIDAVEHKAYKSSYEYDNPVELLLEENKWGNKYLDIKDAFGMI